MRKATMERCERRPSGAVGAVGVVIGRGARLAVAHPGLETGVEHRLKADHDTSSLFASIQRSV